MLGLWLALLAPTFVQAAESSREELHPQDGPDVDLRIEVTESQVKVDVGLNLAFVDEILEPTREELDALHEVEAQGMRGALVERVREILTLEIDGVAVAPLESGFSWAEADPLMVPLFPNCGARALIQVRLSLAYPAKTPPGRVAIGWSVFPPDLAIAPLEEAPPIEIRALLRAGAEELWIGLSTDQPQFVWSGTLEPRSTEFDVVPLRETQPAAAGLLRRALVLAGGLACLLLGVILLRRSPGPAFFSLALGIGASAWVMLTPGTVAEVSEQDALEIFRPLHANIYRAFDYETESEVYDALARSVDGALLDRLYDQIYSGLVLADDGGALCRISRVDLLEADVEAADQSQPAQTDRFAVNARWTVAGQVHHWGHSHSRTNEYEARYVVQAKGDEWRIAENQILAQRRLEAAPLEPVRGSSEAIPEEL